MYLKNKIYNVVIILLLICFIIIIANFICSRRLSNEEDKILYELQELEISKLKKKSEVLECFIINLNNLDNCKKIQNEYKDELKKHSERVEELEKKFKMSK